MNIPVPEPFLPSFRAAQAEVERLMKVMEEAKTAPQRILSIQMTTQEFAAGILRMGGIDLAKVSDISYEENGSGIDIVTKEIPDGIQQ